MPKKESQKQAPAAASEKSPEEERGTDASGGRDWKKIAGWIAIAFVAFVLGVHSGNDDGHWRGCGERPSAVVVIDGHEIATRDCDDDSGDYWGCLLGSLHDRFDDR
jgi:hypothetical protein